jgi:hypothetical protein
MPYTVLQHPKALRALRGRLRAGRHRAVYAVVGNEVLVTDLFERGAGYDV